MGAIRGVIGHDEDVAQPTAVEVMPKGEATEREPQAMSGMGGCPAQGLQGMVQRAASHGADEVRPGGSDGGGEIGDLDGGKAESVEVTDDFLNGRQMEAVTGQGQGATEQGIWEVGGQQTGDDKPSGW